MKLKNIITTTLLAVVGFVISMVGGMASTLFGTYAMFVHTSIGSLLTATVFLTMCKKIKSRGTIFLYYLIIGLVYIIMGFPPMILIMLATGIIGELIVGNTENYENDNRIGLSFIASELIYSLHGFFFILFLGTEGLAETFPNLFTLEQAQMIYDVFFNAKNITIIVVVQVLASFIGVLIAKNIYNKFFDKKGKVDEILQ